MINVSNQITNISNTPGAITDVIANRPGTAQAGTIFISTDTQEIYSFSGTAWTLVTLGSGGGPTGWDTMLAQNEAQTNTRIANLNTNNFFIENQSNNYVFALEVMNSLSVKTTMGDITGNITNKQLAFQVYSDDLGGPTRLINAIYDGAYNGLMLDFSSGAYYYGDFSNSGNGTYLYINDLAQQITTKYYNGTNTLNDGIFLNFANSSFYFGSISGGNITNISVLDSPLASQIRTTSGISNGDKGLLLDFANYGYYLGDYVNNNNGTTFKVDDNSQTMGWYNTGFGGSNYNYFYVTPNIVALGDFVGVNNQTQLRIDDNNRLIKSVYQGFDNGINIDFSNDIHKFFGNVYNTGITLQDNALGGKTIQMYCNQPIELDDNGTGNFISLTSGSTSGKHLVIKINGTTYKIELKN